MCEWGPGAESVMRYNRSMTDSGRLDMSAALAVLEDLRVQLLALDGEDLNAEVPNHKTLMAAKARVNADLLFTAHLAHVIETEVISQYHRFKGAPHVPHVTTEE